jgi:hypothetical protein
MAKSKPEETKEERRARKAEKKAAKSGAASSSLIDPAGVTKPKSEKKDKKDKKDQKKREVLAEKALNEITNGEVKGKKAVKKEEKSEDGDGTDASAEAGDGSSDHAVDTKENVKSDKGKMSLKDRPVGALVPFAHPLADDKVGKKVFKSVKKGISDPSDISCSVAILTTYSRLAANSQTRRQRSRQSSP